MNSHEGTCLPCRHRQAKTRRDSGLNIIAELDQNKVITEFYVRGLGLGGGIGDIIAEVRTDSTNYYSYNHRGDVVLVTDASGDTTATYEYTAFGEPILNSDTLYDRFIGFSSKEYDVKSGLSYYGFRYYDQKKHPLDEKRSDRI